MTLPTTPLTLPRQMPSPQIPIEPLDGLLPDAAGAHRHRGTRAVQRMVEHAPSSGGLALWVAHQDLPDATPPAGLAAEPGAPPAPSRPAEPPARPAALAATDGHTVFYAPAFEALSLPQQTGLVAHQVLHIALRHAQRYLALRAVVGDVDLQLYNTCADAIVNSTLAHLGWLQLQPGAVQLPGLLEGVLERPESAESLLLRWDVEALYRAIDDRQPPARGPRQRAGSAAPASGQQAGQSPQPSRADGPRSARVRALGQATATDLLPDAGAAGPPEHEAELARDWRERLLRGHAGDGAHAMLRALIADLPRPRTPWQQVLRGLAAHALAQQPGLSWSRPSRSYLANQGRAGPGRRMPWEPGRTASSPAPRLVVVVDVSGSIDAPLLQAFATEIEALSRRLGAGLGLILGDDQVRHTAHFEPGRSSLREIQFQGGGGTHFGPMLAAAAAQRPDLIVVLTDLQGPAGPAPRCPVVWAVPEVNPMPVAPFGRLLPLR